MPPSLCVLTAYNAAYKDLASISVPSIRRLADAHGYALRVVERDDCVRRGGWMKIEPIIAALADGFDFVLWLDTDTFVARTNIDIRNIIHPDVQLHMAWHKIASGADPHHFNTGVMLIRASDWSRNFFARVWDRGPLDHRWNDQATIHHVLGYDEIAQRGADRGQDIGKNPLSSLNVTWNSIPNVCALDDPVIWHYAGMGMESRLRAMNEIAGANA